MAIDREKESQAAQLYGGKEDDDLDTYEHSGESLLSLVQPELANLSSHWFHALKDHALLSLPPGEEWIKILFFINILYTLLSQWEFLSCEIRVAFPKVVAGFVSVYFLTDIGVFC